MVLGNANTGMSLTNWRVLEGDRLERSIDRYLQMYRRRSAVHQETCDAELRSLQSRGLPLPIGMRPPRGESKDMLTIVELKEGYRIMCDTLRADQVEDDDDERSQWTLRWNRWSALVAAQASTTINIAAASSKKSKMTSSSSSSEGKAEHKDDDSKVESKASVTVTGDDEEKRIGGQCVIFLTNHGAGSPNMILALSFVCVFI
jgi:hypothetical protein